MASSLLSITAPRSLLSITEISMKRFGTAVESEGANLSQRVLKFASNNKQADKSDGAIVDSLPVKSPRPSTVVGGLHVSRREELALMATLHDPLFEIWLQRAISELPAISHLEMTSAWTPPPGIKLPPNGDTLDKEALAKVHERIARQARWLSVYTDGSYRETASPPVGIASIYSTHLRYGTVLPEQYKGSAIAETAAFLQALRSLNGGLGSPPSLAHRAAKRVAIFVDHRPLVNPPLKMKKGSLQNDLVRLCRAELERLSHQGRNAIVSWIPGSSGGADRSKGNKMAHTLCGHAAFYGQVEH